MTESKPKLGFGAGPKLDNFMYVCCCSPYPQLLNIIGKQAYLSSSLNFPIKRGLNMNSWKQNKISNLIATKSPNLMLPQAFISL